MSMELASLDSYPDARCNDGSNAGYYFLPAPSNSSRDWVVMLDSGGWCWAKLTRAPRGLRTVRTGYAYQPPA